MIIDIITLFPDFFINPLNSSIIKRAQDKNLVTINLHNLRNWATDKHSSVDDRPYGGGTGMILKVEPIYSAIKDLKKKTRACLPTGRTKPHIILLTPKGKTYNQKIAQSLSKKNHLILLCGHYEGFDHRITKYVHDQISVGSYILTGGETPALVLIDSITRLIPNVLKKEATQDETFTKNLSARKYPQYTRPENFNGQKVPKILLSGNHQQIAAWRQKMTKKS